MSVLQEITMHPLNEGEYIKEETTKSQIYLHHTAGNSDPFGVVNDWNTDSRGRIGTCVVIGGGKHDGKIIQAFSSKYWAYHLGVKSSVFQAHKVPYINLDRNSIGIEICAWGQLTLKDGKFYNYVNRVVPEKEVSELNEPYRGFKYFHKYSDAQIESTRKLLLFWGNRYGIPLKYSDSIWKVHAKALKGEPGVYTHCSVRGDKIDVFPQPELIQMLKSL